MLEEGEPEEDGPLREEDELEEGGPEEGEPEEGEPEGEPLPEADVQAREALPSQLR